MGIKFKKTPLKPKKLLFSVLCDYVKYSRINHHLIHFKDVFDSILEQR